MDIILAFRIRLYIFKNFVKKISFFRVVTVLIFLFVLGQILNYFGFDSKLIRNENLIDRITLKRLVDFWALLSIYLYLKTSIGKNKFKFRGIYSYIVKYATKEMDRIYIFYILDKMVFSIGVFTLCSFFVYGLSKIAIILSARIALIILFLSFSTFFSKLYTYVVAKRFKRFSLIFINLAGTTLCLALSHNVKLILAVMLFMINYLAYKKLEYTFRVYAEDTITNSKYNSKIFCKVYLVLKCFCIPKNVAFIATKEFVQIYTEKIPLMYSFLYGTVILMIAPGISIKSNIQEMYFFLYFISISYTLIGLSLNLCARDSKKEWIYKLYKMTSLDIMIGKFLTFFFYGIFITFFYTIAYKFLGIVSGSYISDIFSLGTIAVVFMGVFPIAYSTGGILGSYFTLKVKHKQGNIDYSYNGSEIIVLLIAVYAVSLPAYLYLAYFTSNAIVTAFLIVYQILLLVFLKHRLYVKNLKRE